MVDIEIVPASYYRVVCTFLKEQISTNKTCVIVYGLVGSNCSTSSQRSGTSRNSTMTIYLLLENKSNKYCFSVTANNGTFQAIVEGTFKTG